MLKSRLIYIGIILVSFIFSQALYESVSFMTFVIVLILPIVSILIALAVYPLVSAKILTVNTSVYRLDSFVIRVLLKGVSPFVSPAVKITCHVPDESGLEIKKTVFAVSPSFSSKFYFDYDCKLINRGNYEISIDSVEYYDFLKLIRIKKRIKNKLSLSVLARKIKVDIPVASELYNQENTYLLGDKTVTSGGDMVGIRDYVLGDNLKNVHWKLSSKTDELISKVYAEDICDRAFIIVDMSCYHEDIYVNKALTDCVVETALCAIEEYFKSSVRFGVILSDSKSTYKRISVAAPSDRIQASCSVSTAGMLKDTDLAESLGNIDFNIFSGSEVLIISSFDSPEYIRDIQKMFISKKVKLNIVDIVENETADSADAIVFSRDYLENQVRGIK